MPPLCAHQSKATLIWKLLEVSSLGFVFYLASLEEDSLQRAISCVVLLMVRAQVIPFQIVLRGWILDFFSLIKPAISRDAENSHDGSKPREDDMEECHHTEDQASVAQGKNDREQEQDLMGLLSTSSSSAATTLGSTFQTDTALTSQSLGDSRIEIDHHFEAKDTAKAPFDKEGLLDSGFLSTSSASSPYCVTHPEVDLNPHTFWKNVRRDLHEAVEEAFPRRHEGRYSRVKVLLMSWKSGSKTMKDELDRLNIVFGDEFNFETEEFLIPDETPARAFSRKIDEFTAGEEFDLCKTLFILYYAGHATRDDATGTRLWKAKNTRDSPSLDADLPVTLTTEISRNSSFDTLFLLDCCYPVPRRTERHHKESVCEMIAACADMQALEACDDSFTSLLINELYLASREQTPITTVQLYDKLVSRSQNAEPKVKYKKGDSKHEPVREMTTGLAQIGRSRRIPCYRPLSSSQKPSRQRHIEIARLPAKTDASSNDDDSIDAPYDAYSLANIKAGMPDKVEQVEVILAISLEGQHSMPELVREFSSWACEAPPQAKRVQVLQAIRSCSTLLMVQVPVAVWAALDPSPAIRFVGFTKENLSRSQMQNSQTQTSAYTPLQESRRARELMSECLTRLRLLRSLSRYSRQDMALDPKSPCTRA